MRQMIKTSLLILVLCAAVAGQEANSAKTASQSDPLSGKQLYARYCALCHGADAKGGGPFSPQLKVWPPDLTQLAKKNNGVFPALHLAETINGESAKNAHGSREMPIWGPVFRSLAHGHDDSAQLQVDNLVKYLESIQQK